MVLSRHLGEEILIGDDIIIVVVGIERGRVRLGIKAPLDVVIDRKEVRESKDEKYKPRSESCPPLPGL